jgi:phytoene/squalene synthetase
MTGNARKHRNKELTSSLSDLFIVADEIKKNAGNLDWEKSHGSICTQAVNNLTKRIHSLTKGVEGQIDSVSLNKGLKDIHKVLGEAAEASADPEHKNRLTEVKEFMDFVAKAIAEAFAKIFGKDAGPGRAKPSM